MKLNDINTILPVFFGLIYYNIKSHIKKCGPKQSNNNKKKEEKNII